MKFEEARLPKSQSADRSGKVSEQNRTAGRSAIELAFPGLIVSPPAVRELAGTMSPPVVSPPVVKELAGTMSPPAGRSASIKAYADFDTAFLSGVKGEKIKVEAGLLPGLPFFDVVGLPDRSIKEALKRVKSALLGLGQGLPRGQITVNLAPAELAKSGSGFDLPIALSVLALNEKEQAPSLGPTAKAWPGGSQGKVAAVGELGLNGEVLPVRGIFAIVASLIEGDYKQIIFPGAQLSLLHFFQDQRLLAVNSLREAAAACGLLAAPKEHPSPISGGQPGQANGPVRRKSAIRTVARVTDGAEDRRLSQHSGADPLPTFYLPGTVRPVNSLLKIPAQEHTLRGLICALAGGHHTLLVGSPGSGKSVMAGLCASLLPLPSPLTTLRILSTYSAIYSMENWPEGRPAAPVRAPHHTITPAGLRGSRLQPGEVSLADGGVLFLDELAEASPATLSILRQPLETGLIRLSYQNMLHEFPAHFIFIGAANPCPCGLRYERDGRCRCTEGQKQHYMTKLFGPLGDRISLFIETGTALAPLPTALRERAEEPSAKKSGDRGGGASSAEGTKELLDLADLRQKIKRARSLQLFRNGGRRGAEQLNADLDPVRDRSKFLLGKHVISTLDEFCRSDRLSVRSRYNLLRTARTFADLEESEYLLPDHLMEAAFYRSFS